MLKITSDQLSYILERKFPGIVSGKDFVLAQSVDSSNRCPYTGQPTNKCDAQIIEWRLKSILQPPEKELERIWNILEEQYHAEADRPDSKMYLFLMKRKKVKVQINEEL